MTVDPGSQAGLATILFTDLEGGTRLWEQEPGRMPSALARHDELARKAVEENRGILVKLTGGGLLALFDESLDAVNAALQLQLALADPAATHGFLLRSRCGLHAGVVEHRDRDYFGTALNRAARIMGTAHGGQVLLSRSVAVLLGDSLPADVSLRDLGSVRLRGLDTPEHVFQVVHPELRQHFPVLGGLEVTPTNLPVQESTFIGRGRERAELARLLGSARLLTVVGAVGIGKTRLVVQVGSDAVERFADGVWLVELAALSDPHQVEDAVAQVLRLSPEPGMTLGQTLAAYVAPRTMLLILDRCGHIIDGCARLADALLRAAPGLRIVATSREPLRIAGEQAFFLQPLPLPDLAQPVTAQSATSSDAVALFVDRARQKQPDFALTEANARAVAEICVRLDGIPLAVELAAGRVDKASVEEIDARLGERISLLAIDDRFAWPELQTMHALIDRSYDRLPSAERTLFNRLSVFAGGFNLEAAEQVCSAPPLAPDDVLDALTALIDKSLVVTDESCGYTRYRLFEILRDYARDRASEDQRALADIAATSARHAEHFAGLARSAQAGEAVPYGSGKPAWLVTERENLRAASVWARKWGGDPELARDLDAAIPRTDSHAAAGVQ